MFNHYFLSDGFGEALGEALEVEALGGEAEVPDFFFFPIGFF
jgi:hypothetical protein